MFNRKPGKRALAFIFITVFIDMTGMGIIIPVMPQLIMELTGEPIAQAARLGGILLFTYAIMQFFMSPVIGGLSDRFGRRPVLLLSLLGYSIDYALMGFAPTFAWLFVGRAVSGAFAATHATANAYIADVSPPEKRAANFGLIGAAFGLGFIIGPALGGYLAQFGPRAPFFAAGGLAFLNFVYGFLVVPETLPKENRRRFNWKRANPFGSLYHMRLYPAVYGILAALFIYHVGHMSLPATWSYVMIEKLSWSEAQIGLSLAFIGLLSALVQGGLTRVAIPKLGERRAALIGMAAAFFGMLGFAFGVSTAHIYIALVILALGGFVMPSFMGVLSKAVPSNEQGELQGAIASLMAVALIITPVFMTQVFAAFSEPGAPIYFPGAPYLVAGALTLAAATVFILSARGKRGGDQTEDTN